MKTKLLFILLFGITAYSQTPFPDNFMLNDGTGKNLAILPGTKLEIINLDNNADYTIENLVKTTNDITEGTNLFYTPTRARSAVSAGSGLSYNQTTGIFSNTAQNVVQTLSIAGSNLSLSNGGGTVALPSSGATFLANTTVSQTAVVALLGGVRKVTITGVTGVLAGDRVLLTPTGTTPVGYALADVIATAANTLEVNFTAPALALGASFSIPCKVTVFR